MKKSLKVVVSLLVLLVIICAFIGCEKNPQTTESFENGVIVTIDSSKASKAKGDKLIDYLDVLVADEILTYKGEEGSYGLFITEINGIQPKQGEYWMIYSSSTKNASTEYTYEHDGKTWYSINFGVSSMPFEEGVQYLFVVQGF